MRIARSLALFATLSLAALGACSPPAMTGGDATTGTDASTGGDAMTGGDARPADARGEGGTSSDPCSATEDNATSTLGCNGGFASGAYAANAPGGACTVMMDAEGNLGPGTCTTANAYCVPANDGDRMGVCVIDCTEMAGTTYVSNGGCPRGFRCFNFGTEGGASCYRDCNGANACPSGEMCDEDGSCVPMMSGM